MSRGAARALQLPGVGALAAALLAGALCWLAIFAAQWRGRSRAWEQERLELVARAGAARLREGDAAAELRALREAVPGIARAVVLEGRTVRAAAGGGGSAALDRASLADKALYDRAVRTRALVAEGRDAVLRGPAFDAAHALVSAPVDARAERVFLAELDPRRAPGADLGSAMTFAGALLLVMAGLWTGVGRITARFVPTPRIATLAVLAAQGGNAIAVWNAARQRVDALVAARAELLARLGFEAGPPPFEAPETPSLLGAALTGAFALAMHQLVARGWAARVARAARTHAAAYAYISPAMVGMAVLVFVPVLFGLALGLLTRRAGAWHFAGAQNYLDILLDPALADPDNFYFKLAVTFLWTALNVALHAGIGLALALLLNDPMLRARGVYRVLLVVPWAVPNYITALIWKGMFHKQFGAVNHLIALFGAEPVAWFQQFWTAFLANVATNTWLGFPFMMVVSLGALQSIPTDLYEAAQVDGAGRWARFRHITLPLLAPALVPAIVVGWVWTFNMFNIIYLVSGGAPQGATDILVTDAYRWAFERDDYGRAAALSTLIFVILLGFTVLTNRFTRATEAAEA